MITYEEVVLYRVFDTDDRNNTKGFYEREEQAATAASLLNRGEGCQEEVLSGSSTTAPTRQ